MSGNGPFPGSSHEDRRSEEFEDSDGQYAYPAKPEPAPPAAPQPQRPQHQYPQDYGQQQGQQAQYPQDYGQQAPRYPMQQTSGSGQNGFGPHGRQQPEQKSRLLAGLLGIFLGGFGVHRFYLGNNGVGIAQVAVTCFTGMGPVWGFVEGVMILCNARSFRTDAHGVPLK